MSRECRLSSLRNEYERVSQCTAAGDVQREPVRSTRWPIPGRIALASCWIVLLLSTSHVVMSADSAVISPAENKAVASPNAERSSSVTQTTSSASQLATSTPQAQTQKASTAEAGLRMQVTGIEDAPRVLSIVPWKSLTTPVSGPTFPPLAEDVWSPVEPDSFRRELQYFERVRARGPEPQVPAGSPPEGR